MGKIFVFLFYCLGIYSQQAQNSMTGRSTPYRETCKEAALNDEVFQKFRSIRSYFDAVECGQAGDFAQYLTDFATPKTLLMIPEFRKLDLHGDPVRNEIPNFGLFSGTTLRYVVFADLMSRLFDLPKDCSIVEIGAGFGGQAYVLSQLLSFADYYIYDLPETERLIEKMMATLNVRAITCLDLYAELPKESIDLFISNYALSECDRATQLDYFQRVVTKAKRGYMLFNDTNIFDHLSLSEWVELFQAHGICIKVRSEPVFSYTGNYLLTWDGTK